MPFQFGRMNFDFWPMGRIEFLASQFDGVTGYTEKTASRQPEGDCGNKQQSREQGYVSIRLVKDIVPPVQKFNSSFHDVFKDRHEPPIKNVLIFFSGLIGGGLLFILGRAYLMKRSLASADRRAGKAGRCPEYQLVRAP
jgi:hypothetical protein